MTEATAQRGRRFVAGRSLRRSALLLILLATPLTACQRGRCCVVGPAPVACPPPSAVPCAPACGPAAPAAAPGTGRPCVCWPAYTGNPRLGSAAQILARIDGIALARLKDPKTTDPRVRQAWRAVREECKTQRDHGRTCPKHTCEELYRRVHAAHLLASVGDGRATFVALNHAD
jgi:hypothetical protein